MICDKVIGTANVFVVCQLCLRLEEMLVISENRDISFSMQVHRLSNFKATGLMLKCKSSEMAFSGVDSSRQCLILLYLFNLEQYP